MMKAVRIDTMTTGWTHQRSFRRVGVSGPPRVPPSTTLVELSTALTHSPCYRPTFECPANLRHHCDSLLLRDRASGALERVEIKGISPIDTEDSSGVWAGARHVAPGKRVVDRRLSDIT